MNTQKYYDCECPEGENALAYAGENIFRNYKDCGARTYLAPVLLLIGKLAYSSMSIFHSAVM